MQTDGGRRARTWWVYTRVRGLSIAFAKSTTYVLLGRLLEWWIELGLQLAPDRSAGKFLGMF